ncbi:flavin-containing monooxygenase [Trujillonella humicola]|uniref:flavin-containing monooxygenase n=1 Tax=Trujillonella humicola TaxID=3383699 RepID=UPI003905ED9F
MADGVEVDVVVVGAGFAGLYAVHDLRRRGFRVRAFERGDGVGGTWFWNRYPGARCDIESMEYSYSFDEDLQQEWTWSRRYPTQPEMLAYAEHVADRFDLRRDITFGTNVTGALYDERRDVWTVATDGGEQVTTRFLVLATGVLSATRVPEFPGLERFRGEVHHTARWPVGGVDVTGKRVGVIGTGSSGIQAVPQLAALAARLTVFQRTANYSISAENDALTEEQIRETKQNYAALREKARRSFTGSTTPIHRQSALAVSAEERHAQFEERWRLGGFPFLGSYDDVMRDLDANALAAEFVRGKIRSIVRDPAVADLLTPTDHPIGSKRICVDTDYFATYNLDHVRLVSVRERPIAEITETGLRTGDEHHDLDVLVLATGFDAMTGSFTRIDIRGRGGRTLAQKWAEGARTYLGVMTAGFPNLFTLTGPGSPAVLCNMFLAIEQHVDWVGRLLTTMAEQGHDVVEPTVASEEEWTAHVDEAADGTLYKHANSWYVGSNVPGKPRVFLPYAGGVGRYRKICDSVADDGYRGFVLGRAGAGVPA